MNTVCTFMYMKSPAVSIAEFKRKMGVYMRRVRAGGSVILTDRNRPVAEVRAIPESGPRLKVVPPRKDPRALRPPARVSVKGEGSSLDALNADREER